MPVSEPLPDGPWAIDTGTPGPDVQQIVAYLTAKGNMTDTELVALINEKVDKSNSVGYQIWNGSSWSTRPTGYGHVEAYSDGTRGSTSDAAAPLPTGRVNGDRWNKAAA